MKSRTLKEWIQLYEKKTGTKFEPNPRGTIMFYPERGFAEIGSTKDMVIIGQVSGDAKFWKQTAEVMAKERRITHLGTWCIRNIKAYMKFFGAEIERIEDAGEGYERYHCRLKDTGKPALFSPTAINSAGNVVYMVTWEI